MPFSESESMTIKRLEVALRKMDFQLLKDGAYKLHEKFYSGHKFDYIQELRQIYEFIQTRENIPPETSKILKSTIEDIFKRDEEDRSWETAGVQEVEYDNLNRLDEIISKLDDPKTSPPESAMFQAPPVSQEEPAPQPPVWEQPMQQSLLVDEVDSSTSTQGNFGTANIDELPDAHSHGDFEPKEESIGDNEDSEHVAQSPNENTLPENILIEQPQGSYVERSFDEIINPEPVQEHSEDTFCELSPEEEQSPQEHREECDNEVFPEIAVFYDDALTDIDFSVIKDYRNQLNALFSKNQQCEEFYLLKQIANISNIIDTPIDDVDKIISTLTTVKNKVSFLTTSQSQNFLKMFIRENLDFEIPFVKKAKNPEKTYSVIPMLGFSNIFVCSNCNARNLKTDFNSRTLSVQCPECDGAGFPDLYAVNSYNPDCNPIFWHRAFATLVKAKIWVLINPPLDENKEVIFDFLKTAYDAAAPERIYLLSNENDKREFYKQTFNAINPSCDLRCACSTQEKLCEDFINTEIMLKVSAQ